MKAYLSDIIPSLARFSNKINNAKLLMKSPWVSIGDYFNKVVFIYRPNGILLISRNGIVEKAKWEYIGNDSILIETSETSYRYKHGFFDEKILALQIDGNKEYIFFVNEGIYDKVNSVEAVTKLLLKTYTPALQTNNSTSSKTSVYRQLTNSQYRIIAKKRSFDLAFGNYTKFVIEYFDKKIFEVYIGDMRKKYFFITVADGIIYCNNFHEAVENVYNNQGSTTL